MLSPFKISRFPITNRQYLDFVRDTGARPPRHWNEGRIPEGKENHPVVYVSWTDAEAYCAWLTARVGREFHGVVALPTEAQWEFAARGVEGRRYPWGEEEPTAEHASFAQHVGDTTPVDRYPQGATPSGIHDLAGNVWEWCRDWYGGYSGHPARDPTGPAKGERRVLRGGSFYSAAPFLRAASRLVYPPEGGNGRFGFRVVWSSPGGQK